VARAGQLVTNGQLLQTVWGPHRGDKDSNLRVHLGRIRQKLEPVASRPRYFVTEVGLGYRFQTPES
jgi:two-component system KDP operon response regulator KdpE